MWPLGKFISDTLEARGGRQNGWTQSRIAKTAKISSGHLSWIIHGEASGKKGAPDIGMDTLISLAKALNIKEQILIDAYKGSEPDIPDSIEAISQQTLNEIIGVLMKNIPDQILAEALVAVKTPEKIQELLAEAKRRHEKGSASQNE
jgi:transcriptional regulator with XRE-family HTH domain